MLGSQPTFRQNQKQFGERKRHQLRPWRTRERKDLLDPTLPVMKATSQELKYMRWLLETRKAWPTLTPVMC